MSAIGELLKLELEEGPVPLHSELGGLRNAVEHVTNALDRIEERLGLADIQASRNYDHLQRQDQRLAEAGIGDRASTVVKPLPHAK